MRNKQKLLIFIIGTRNRSNLYLKYFLEQQDYKVLLIERSDHLLQFIIEEKPDLILTELKSQWVDGQKVFNDIRSRKNLNYLPIAMILKIEDKYRVKELNKLGVDYIIVKPFEEQLKKIAQDLRGLIISSKDFQNNIIKEAGITGSLKDMNVVELIQTFDINEKTGVLVLDHRGKTGFIYFEKGKVVGAKIDKLIGEMAFYRISKWFDGSFLFENNVQIEKPNISISTQTLVMESMRRLDEMNKILQKLGDNSNLVKTEINPEFLSDQEMSVYKSVDNKTTLIKYLDFCEQEELDFLMIVDNLIMKDFLKLTQNVVAVEQEKSKEKKIKKTPDEKVQVKKLFDDVLNKLFQE